MERDAVLAALKEKPLKAYAILMRVAPSGSEEELQALLLQMRDDGLIKFDIHKGRWSPK